MSYSQFTNRVVLLHSGERESDDILYAKNARYSSILSCLCRNRSNFFVGIL